jgi:hypothetical protein
VAGKNLLVVVLIAIFAGCSPTDPVPPVTPDIEEFPVPTIEWDPRRYVCYLKTEPLVVDGRLDDPAWRLAPWTESFVDIRGEMGTPPPRFRTRAKLLWDESNLYIAAELEEPDVQGSLTERDSVIFHDNDFEVFIDPDGDTHDYFELEINALGTEWDLRLRAPYRDAESPAVDAWDIVGLRTAIGVDGTLNSPGDKDQGWTVEIAMPWVAFAGHAGRTVPPTPDDVWRLNFSRVEWRTEVRNGAYVKQRDPVTDEPWPEDNWVWSPQGLIAMHYPEMWGFVKFSRSTGESGTAKFEPSPDESPRWLLRRLYYAQMRHHASHGVYSDDLAILEFDAETLPLDLRLTSDGWEAATTTADGQTLRIRADGRIL